MTLCRRAALLGSFALLALVGVGGVSAASPGLGPRGWAPGSLGLGMGSGAVTAVLWAAYLLGAVALVLGLRRAPTRTSGWLPVLLLALVALSSNPFGSADHTNYAAYGRIAAQGGDPYTVAPVTWHGGHDPITAAVEAPWTHTPSIYGPLATLLQLLTSLVGRANLRETVWAWQVVVVVAWLLVRVLLRRLVVQLAEADLDGVRSGYRRVDLLWTFNPILFGVLVLGAHVDVVAVLFVLAALVLVGRNPVLPGLAVGASVSTKVIYGVVALALLWAWWHARRGSWLRDLGLLVLGVVLVAAPLYVWAGLHVFRQLGNAGGSSSLATAWSLLVQLLRHVLPEWAVTATVLPLAVLVAVLLAIVLARLVRVGAGRLWVLDVAPTPVQVTATAVGVTFALSAAYVVAAPYSLPWYDAPVWATLPLLSIGTLDVVVVLRYAAMALAYVPGRVLDMSAEVQSVTLGYRRSWAPWATVLAWAAIVVLYRRARRPAPEQHLES